VRMLLVDGDNRMVQDLAQQLAGYGFLVDSVGTGTDATASEPDADLMLLSMELPDLDGLEVCRRVRARSQIPIIAMAGNDTELDRVLGLEAGLDDYVIKPFGLLELMARIDAVMRRVRPRRGVPATAAEDVIRLGTLLVDVPAHEVRVCDSMVHLTRKEFGLLVLLASEPGAVFSRRQIMAEVWRNEVSSSRTVDTHVGSLRAKLGERSWIETVYGVGFRLRGEQHVTEARSRPRRGRRPNH
jgi:DNA-binding response OmpR family regulator